MERCKEILSASLLWRVIDTLCRWVGGQWKNSASVCMFLNPPSWGQQAAQASVIFKIWELLRGGLSKLYGALKLDRLFDGSVFNHVWFWCALPVVLAPVVPTMALLGLVLVGFAALALRLIRRRQQTLVYSDINRWILLYAAVYVAVTIAAINVAGTLQVGALRVVFVLFAVVLINALEDRRTLDLVIFMFVVVAALVSFYGICQYLFGWGYQSTAWWDGDMFKGINFRVTSTLENPNMLGQYLILAIPLGGAGLLSARDRKSRIFYFAACAVMCVCIILTMSRGAWLGILFAGIVFAMFLNPRLALLAPLALIVLYLVLPETVVGRFISIGDMGDNSTSYRVSIWMGTLNMLKDYWMSGVGPGEAAFNSVYPDYSLTAAYAQHSHNLFLQIVCDAGILELLIFLALIVTYVRSLCASAAVEIDGRSRIHQIAFLSGVVGFLVQAMTDYSFYNYRVMFIFFAYLALGAVSARRSALEEGGKLPWQRS